MDWNIIGGTFLSLQLNCWLHATVKYIYLYIEVMLMSSGWKLKNGNIENCNKLDTHFWVTKGFYTLLNTHFPPFWTGFWFLLYCRKLKWYVFTKYVRFMKMCYFQVTRKIKCMVHTFHALYCLLQASFISLSSTPPKQKIERIT